MGGPANWSTDNLSNQAIDPDCYLAEGQAPPTINDGVRGVMVGVKKYAIDQSCAGTAIRGSGNDYQLATTQGFTADAVLVAHSVAFLVDQPNTDDATLSLDGQTKKPLRGQSNHILAAGELVVGVRYRASYVPSLGRYVVDLPGSGGTTTAPTTPTTSGDKSRFLAAKQATQSVSSNTNTKLVLPAAPINVGGYFDITQSQVKPKAACTMLIGATVTFSGGVEANQSLVCFFYKNGSQFARKAVHTASTNVVSCDVTALVDFDGASDYVEVYVSATGSSTKTVDASAQRTFVWGHVVS